MTFLSMASTPTNGSSLVHSKGIKSIQLLCAREPKARLDNGPFNIIYAATLVYGLVLAAQGRMYAASILPILLAPHTYTTGTTRESWRMLPAPLCWCRCCSSCSCTGSWKSRLPLHSFVPPLSPLSHTSWYSVCASCSQMLSDCTLHPGGPNRICWCQGNCACHPSPAGTVTRRCVTF